MRRRFPASIVFFRLALKSPRVIASFPVFALLLPSTKKTTCKREGEGERKQGPAAAAAATAEYVYRLANKALSADVGSFSSNLLPFVYVRGSTHLK